MKNIQVFDPGLCCQTGVCGVEVDPVLVTFSADADWARKQGIGLERFNLATQPMDFVNHPLVKSLLDGPAGENALPVTLVDGQIALVGRYPSREELATWAGLEKVGDRKSSEGCCTPSGGASSGC